MGWCLSRASHYLLVRLLSRLLINLATCGLPFLEANIGPMRTKYCQSDGSDSRKWSPMGLIVDKSFFVVLEIT
jgi:hypothetical protein